MEQSARSLQGDRIKKLAGAGIEPATTDDNNTALSQQNHNKNHTLQQLAEGAERTSRALPDHFPDTSLHEKCATYVQWDGIPEPVKWAITTWLVLPETTRKIIQRLCEDAQLHVPSDNS